MTKNSKKIENSKNLQKVHGKFSYFYYFIIYLYHWLIFPVIKIA